MKKKKKKKKREKGEAEAVEVTMANGRMLERGFICGQWEGPKLCLCRAGQLAYRASASLDRWVPGREFHTALREGSKIYLI